MGVEESPTNTLMSLRSIFAFGPACQAHPQREPGTYRNELADLTWAIVWDQIIVAMFNTG